MHAHPFIRTNCRKQTCARGNGTQRNVEPFHEYSGMSKAHRESRVALVRLDRPRGRTIDLGGRAFAELSICRGEVFGLGVVVSRVSRVRARDTPLSIRTRRHVSIPCTDKHASRSRCEIGGGGRTSTRIRWKSAPNVNEIVEFEALFDNLFFFFLSRGEGEIRWSVLFKKKSYFGRNGWKYL